MGGLAWGGGEQLANYCINRLQAMNASQGYEELESGKAMQGSSLKGVLNDCEVLCRLGSC